MPPKRKYPGLKNQNQCSKEVMSQFQNLRNRVAVEQQKVEKLQDQLLQTAREGREKCKRDDLVIHTLGEQLKELGFAHKALKGQYSALDSARRAGQELHMTNMQRCEAHVKQLGVECEGQHALVARLEEEIDLLKSEKAFVLEQYHTYKSEARAKVSAQLDKVAAAKVVGARKSNQVSALQDQLAQAKMDKVATRHTEMEWYDQGAGAGDLQDPCG